MGYIQQLRALVGHRPLIMVGAAVLVVANVVAAYLSRSFRGEIKASSEASEFCFFDLKELPEELSPPDKPILEQYLYSLT
jgi:hypothetical protein